MKKFIFLFIMLFAFTVTANAEETVQGPGFDTDREAVEAYINAFIAGDISEILSTCAVESYVDGYSLVKNAERIGALNSPTFTGAEIPLSGDFARQLNIEARRSELTDMIRKQFLGLQQVKAISEENVGKMIPLKDYDSAEALINDMYGEKEIVLSYKGDIIPNVLLSSNYYRWNSLKNLWKYADVAGADRQGSVAAIVYANDEPFLLTLGTIQYDGKWYITNISVIGMVLGATAYSGGLVPLNVSEDVLAQINSDAFRLLVEINDEVDAIDIGMIMSLPEDEQEKTFNEELDKLGEKYADAEETIYALMELVLN